jgi:hypothetical protein
MKGYPKHINTRQDVENAMAIDPDRTRAYLQRAIDGREGWVITGHLDAEADGVTDDTHRVKDQGDAEEGTHDWYQEEWKPLPGNTLDRLGISVAEAQAMIEE